MFGGVDSSESASLESVHKVLSKILLPLLDKKRRRHSPNEQALPLQHEWEQEWKPEWDEEQNLWRGQVQVQE